MPSLHRTVLEQKIQAGSLIIATQVLKDGMTDRSQIDNKQGRQDIRPDSRLNQRTRPNKRLTN